MTTPLFLTRAQHDFVLSANQPLLARAFADCRKRQWNLSGVAILGLPIETATEIRALVEGMN